MNSSDIKIDFDKTKDGFVTIDDIDDEFERSVLSSKDDIDDFDIDLLQQLLNDFRPTVVFHPKEKFLPTNLDTYLMECQVKNSDNVIIYDRGQFDLKKLEDLDYNARYDFNSHDKQFWEDFKYPELETVQIYGTIEKQIDIEFPDRKVWVLMYIAFMPFNGSNWMGLGAHQSDFEHIIVHVDVATRQAVRVYFSSHSQDDGYWLRAQDCEFRNDKLVIYSALNFHGFYHKPKTYWRIFGCANDYTANGKEWNPDVNFANFRHKHNWLNINATWGNGHISTPNIHRWFDKSFKSNNFWRRMFCCWDGVCSAFYTPYCGGCCQKCVNNNDQNCLIKGYL